ncbi:Glycosyltransferase involved in cell wall bisynthesis [Abditibacterium utsteinense]|uniref:Glycosyltransferase involved in cell wall bisynthesis n=2 Tax=Abditibacterium utsteinense TaxID=1960156 RepID=A0A2S8SWN4_9BACT|nr:Glycosyltransferase involved in cell wall bisynthesis [Abditibacterium utsteinense]
MRDTGAQVSFEFADREQGRRAVAARIAARLQERFDLVYLEGTGIAAGWPLLLAGRKGQKYLVSSGDPISGFVKTTSGPLQGRAFGYYERLLMRGCTGFVGWTPYLTGRALELGAPRAITVEGGADRTIFHSPSPQEKQQARQRFGIAQNHIVCVVVGSLQWNQRQSYSYGLELIELLRYLKRSDVSMLIVGDGTGKTVLESRLRIEDQQRVIFTGRLPQNEVTMALHAADIGFVTQTLDGLGNYRLTTKLPEYLASGLGIAMSPVPGFYDYVFDAGWPLPARHPASENFHRGCAKWLDALTRQEISRKSARAIQIAKERFDAEDLAKRFSRFVQDIW